VFLEPDDMVERMRNVRARCEAAGRDAGTLRFSLYERDELMRDAGQRRVDRLGRMAEIGLDRLVAFPTRWSPTLEAQAAFADDCRAAGIALAGAPLTIAPRA
jgi:alkanesulfonate monooxygenase SsuD/methylene tetrahydromethanopterin reductase-like flavin-dependent oxidoreductase (luciferase family)